jgi:hypothetical protein
MIGKSVALGVGGLAVLAAMTMSSQASAQEPGFGAAGQMAFSADRLFGINMGSSTVTIKDKASGQEAEYEYKSTGISLLWSGNGASEVPSASQIPRLSFDYFVIDGLSVGGSLGYLSRTGSGKRTKPTETPEEDDPSQSAFAFAPRVGYALMFTDMIGFWPRGGFTYWQSKLEDKNVNQGTGAVTTSTYKYSALDLNIELPFIFTPAKGFALTAGPVVDYSLMGKVDTEIDPTPPGYVADEVKFKTLNLGLAFGVLGYF